MQIPKGQGVLRVAAILPIVLAPVVVGLFWRTLVLAPDFGVADFVTRSLGLGSHNWLGDPQLALASVIAIHTWQWTPFAFLVLLASLSALPPDIYEAARIDRASAWQRFRHITLPLIRPAIVVVVILRMMTALSAFAAIFAATGGGPGTATEILNLYAYRASFAELNIGLRLRARGRAAGADDGNRRPALLRPEGRMKRAPARAAMLGLVAGSLLLVWSFPVLWGLITSLKTERDVLAYPPVIVFSPTLANYRDGAVRRDDDPAELGVEPDRRRIDDPWSRCCSRSPRHTRWRGSTFRQSARPGFYVLATQMLPPVGLVIPYFLMLRGTRLA
jgi:ABC-type glycerol-3-phosphate transport system permease component